MIQLFIFLLLVSYRGIWLYIIILRSFLISGFGKCLNWFKYLIWLLYLSVWILAGAWTSSRWWSISLPRSLICLWNWRMQRFNGLFLLFYSTVNSGRQNPLSLDFLFYKLTVILNVIISVDSKIIKLLLNLLSLKII